LEIPFRRLGMTTRDPIYSRGGPHNH